MKKIPVTIPVESYLPSELSPLRASLVEQAKEATRGAYAPYSNFHVGAAIRLASGTIIKGANQENAAFSSGTCAERSAVFAVGANYKGETITHIAIAAEKGGDFQSLPISPCGACRQALLEYEQMQHAPIEVILYGSEAVYILPSVASTLPLCFTEF